MIWKYLEQIVLFPKDLNWVQHWVSQIGLSMSVFLGKEWHGHLTRRMKGVIPSIPVYQQWILFLQKYVMWSDIWNVSYIELRSWNQVSYNHCSYEHNFKQLRTEAWKRLFQASVCNCVRNCDDHSLLEKYVILVLILNHQVQTIVTIITVSYTHLTLPTKLEV